MKTLNAQTRSGWTDTLTDTAIVQAERVFAHRKARSQILGSDLFGEPAWDILLYAFIASGNSRVCVAGRLAEELDISVNDMRCWIERLSEQGLIEDHGVTISITTSAQTKIRQLLNAHVREVMHDFGAGDGVIQFSSVGMSESE